ncbi:MAG: hypothetical protein ACYC36_13280 [Bellilinea sp.]
MKQNCLNCKYQDVDSQTLPCSECELLPVMYRRQPDLIEPFRANYWQPARPKRKELEARVAELEARLADREAKLADLRGHEAKFIDLRERYDALKSCYMLNKEPDGPVMIVDFGKVLVEHEAQLAELRADLVAAFVVLHEIKDVLVEDSLNGFFDQTIKSIDAYLSGKDRYSGVYDELAELKVQLADWKRWHQFREEELKVANAELESMHHELADKQAIIDEQKKEIAQLRMWMRLYEWGGGF